MENAALSVSKALDHFALIQFYLDFLNLIVDVQRTDGSVSDLVPNGGGYPADHYIHVHRYFENIRSRYSKTELANLAYQFGDWFPFD